MLFEYAFTYDEFLNANKKYVRKMTALQLAMGIICACLAVVMIVVVCINKFVLNNPTNELGVLFYFFAFLVVIFFSLVLGIRVSAKRANAYFFEEYNEDGIMRYRVELTETHAIIRYKQNEMHFSLKGITRVIQIENCLYVLFKFNTILTVKITDETKQLVDLFKNLAPTKK